MEKIARQIKILLQAIECHVCGTSTKEPKLGPCGHTACGACWMRAGRSCPLCGFACHPRRLCADRSQTATAAAVLELVQVISPHCPLEASSSSSKSGKSNENDSDDWFNNKDQVKKITKTYEKKKAETSPTIYSLQSISQTERSLVFPGEAIARSQDVSLKSPKNTKSFVSNKVKGWLISPTNKFSADSSAVSLSLESKAVKKPNSQKQTELSNVKKVIDWDEIIVESEMKSQSSPIKTATSTNKSHHSNKNDESQCDKDKPMDSCMKNFFDSVLSKKVTNKQGNTGEINIPPESAKLSGTKDPKMWKNVKKMKKELKKPVKPKLNISKETHGIVIGHNKSKLASAPNDVLIIEDVPTPRESAMSITPRWTEHLSVKRQDSPEVMMKSFNDSSSLLSVSEYCDDSLDNIEPKINKDALALQEVLLRSRLAMNSPHNKSSDVCASPSTVNTNEIIQINTGLTHFSPGSMDNVKKMEDIVEREFKIYKGFSTIIGMTDVKKTDEPSTAPLEKSLPCSKESIPCPVQELVFPSDIQQSLIIKDATEKINSLNNLHIHEIQSADDSKASEYNNRPSSTKIRVPLRRSNSLAEISAAKKIPFYCKSKCHREDFSKTEEDGYNIEIIRDNVITTVTIRSRLFAESHKGGSPSMKIAEMRDAQTSPISFLEPSCPNINKAVEEFTSLSDSFKKKFECSSDENSNKSRLIADVAIRYQESPLKDKDLIKAPSSSVKVIETASSSSRSHSLKSSAVNDSNVFHITDSIEKEMNDDCLNAEEEYNIFNTEPISADLEVARFERTPSEIMKCSLKLPQRSVQSQMGKITESPTLGEYKKSGENMHKNVEEIDAVFCIETSTTSDSAFNKKRSRTDDESTTDQNLVLTSKKQKITAADVSQIDGMQLDSNVFICFETQDSSSKLNKTLPGRESSNDEELICRDFVNINDDIKQCGLSAPFKSSDFKETQVFCASVEMNEPQDLQHQSQVGIKQKPGVVSDSTLTQGCPKKMTQLDPNDFGDVTDFRNISMELEVNLANSPKSVTHANDDSDSSVVEETPQKNRRLSKKHSQSSKSKASLIKHFPAKCVNLLPSDKTALDDISFTPFRKDSQTDTQLPDDAFDDIICIQSSADNTVDLHLEPEQVTKLKISEKNTEERTSKKLDTPLNIHNFSSSIKNQSTPLQQLARRSLNYNTMARINEEDEKTITVSDEFKSGKLSFPCTKTSIEREFMNEAFQDRENDKRSVEIATQDRRSKVFPISTSMNILKARNIEDSPEILQVNSSPCSSPPDRAWKKKSIQLACSCLTAKQVATVKAMALKNKWEYSNVFTQQLSHLIVTVDDTNHSQRSVKYMRAIASGAWIVSYAWILQCQVQGKHVDERDYEVLDSLGGMGPRMSRLQPKLFTGFTFMCEGPFSILNKEILHEMLINSGAKVVDTLDEIEIRSPKELKLVLGEVECTQGHDAFLDMCLSKRLVTVNLEWMLNCLGWGELFSLVDSFLVPTTMLPALDWPPHLLAEATDISEQTSSDTEQNAPGTVQSKANNET